MSNSIRTAPAESANAEEANRDVSALRKWWYIAGLSLFVLVSGVLVLPYLIAGQSKVLSVSTLAGFNNSLAVLSYFTAIPALAYSLSRSHQNGTASLQVPYLQPIEFRPPWPVGSVILGHAAVFTALYAYKGGFVFAEALYFKDLLYRMAMGAIPFVDTHFFYGPAMLLPADWFRRVIGLDAAYGLYFVLTYCTGLYVLYLLLDGLTRQRQRAIFWFAVISVGLFNPYAGLNYAWLRHLLPPLTLWLGWRALRQPDGWRFAGAGLVLAVALSYSPEVAVVTLASLALLSVFCLLADRDDPMRLRAGWPLHIALPLSGMAVCGIGFILMDPSPRALRAYLQPILTFAGGGWNTPIDPSLPVAAMTIVTVSALIRTFWFIRRKGWTAETGLVVGFAVMALAFERAALGKADIMHIAYSSLPMLLLAVMLDTGSAARGPKGLLFMAVLVGFVIPLQFFNAMLYVPFVANHMKRMGTTSFAEIQTEPSKAELQADIARAVERFGADRIYYMHKLEYYRLPIYERYHLKPFLYFPSLTSAFTSEDIQAVIQELKVNHAVVIARRQDLVGHAAPAEGRLRWLYSLLASPLPGSRVHDLTLRFQAQLEQPLVAFLTSSYTTGFEGGDVRGLVLSAEP